MAGRQNKASLLGWRDAGRRAAIRRMLAQAHFDKDENRPIPADHIDFSAAYPEIALQDAQAVFLKVGNRQGFGDLAAREGLRGIFVGLSHGEFEMEHDSAVLYVVPTPLGNLADLSRRAIETLCAVSWIAAEDTRHTAPLLQHIGATARLIPAHEHNECEAAEKIVRLLNEGSAVALVSDAGTPGISDPGARIVAAVRQAGHRIVPLPGPSAAITALSAAGLPESHFLFYGFLPVKATQRREALAAWRDLPAALVFYEAPHRILATIEDLAAVLGGERTLVMARELSKLFESIHVCPLGEALDWIQADANRQKGEFVLIVSGGSGADHSEAEALRVLHLLLADGLPVKQAARLAASITGAAKNALYQQALAWKERPAL